MTEYHLIDTRTGALLTRLLDEQEALRAARIFRRLLREPANSLRVQVREHPPPRPGKGARP